MKKITISRYRNMQPIDPITLEVSEEYLEGLQKYGERCVKKKEEDYRNKGLAGIFDGEFTYCQYDEEDYIHIVKHCTVYENCNILQDFPYALDAYPLDNRDNIQRLLSK